MLLGRLRICDLDEIRHDAGAAIMEKGNPGAKVYVLIQGAVAAESNGQIVREITDEGATFG